MRTKLPTDPIREDNDVTNEVRGSCRSANSDSDVKMRFVSRLASPPRDLAMRLYAVRVRMGAKVGAK